MANNRQGGWGLTFFVGAVIGALAALLFSTNEEGEIKTEVKDKVRLLKSKLKEAKESEVVQQIFGERTEKVQKVYREAKAELITRLSRLKGTIEDIDKDKYTQTVHEVVDDLKKNKDITAVQLKKLKKFLSDDYRKLASAATKEK